MRAQSYQVKYRIAGRDYAAGPYSEAEVEYQRRDIRGFQGVEFAYVAPLLPLSLPPHESHDGTGI